MDVMEKINTGIKNAGNIFRNPVSRAVDFVFLRDKNASESKIRRCFSSFFGAVMHADGAISEHEIKEFRRFLLKKVSTRDADEIIKDLKNPGNEDYIKDLQELAPQLLISEKQEILTAALDLAYVDGSYSDNEHSIIFDAAAALGVSPAEMTLIESEFRKGMEDKGRIVSSGTGIIAALGVVFIFVLTATFLKSVLFGIILAYFFLPLERWYEMNVFRSPAAKKVENFILKFTSFFSVFRAAPKPLSQEEELVKEREMISWRASIMSVATVIIGLVSIVAIMVTFSAPYVSKASSSLKDWVSNSEFRNIISGNSFYAPDFPPATETVDSPIAAEKPSTVAPEAPDAQSHASAISAIISTVFKKLEELKPQLAEFEAFNNVRDYIDSYFQSEDNSSGITSEIMKKSEGAVKYIVKTAKIFVNYIVDFLLSFFFFLFFLQKMAVFSSSTRESPGEYLVKGIFNTSWMPRTAESTRREAREILDSIFGRIQTWIRGYLSIIIIEMTLYITMFLILGVPYAIPLGAAAGCTVLLPFIGPILSISSTLIVCLTLGDGSSFQIIGILICYLFVNGLLEQLILYPSLVGNALGLSTIETIIVVLLGGLFAGIPGMIFAVPAASVLKYLTPKIYRQFNLSK